MEYYSIQNILKEYEEHVERENKEYKKQQSVADKQQKMSIPKTPNLKMPNIQMPNIGIPKL